MSQRGRGSSVRGFVRWILAWALLAWPTCLTARESSFYYNEIARTEAIYVFASPENAASFEATGQVGEDWLTRESYGPTGETVIFDSADAVNLYNFKHDLPGEVFEKAEEKKKFPSGEFSGLMFGDYYYFDKHPRDEISEGNPTSPEGQQGFWLRRIYFTYDVDFSEKIGGRLRLEANSNGQFEGGSLEPFVKDAFLKWTYAGKQQVTLGIQPSLTFDWVEGFWGLRHIEKTPADLYRIDSSRDFGIKFSGPVALEGLSYAVQFGNESGTGSETDEYKVLRLEGRFDRKSGFGANLVYDASNRPDDGDRDTFSGFVGYRADAWRVGGNYIFQTRQPSVTSEDQRDQEIEIWSAFGVWEFLPEKASVFVRFDDVSGRKDGETTGLPGADGIDYWLLSPNAPFQMLILGGEWYVLPKVRLSPNAEWAKYENDPDPVEYPGRDEEVIYRLTFFWSW